MSEIDASIAKKNTATAPGLSLVFWGREDSRLLNAVQRVRQSYSDRHGSHIWWYADDHVHSTITALVRTKYDRVAPLKREHLPDRFGEICAQLSSLPPFAVRFVSVILWNNGQLQLGGKVQSSKHQETLNRLRSLTSVIDPGLRHLDSPKIKGESCHLSIGYFQTLPAQPVPTFEEPLPDVVDVSVSAVSVVHYLRRTLEPRYTVGQIHFLLSTPNDHSQEQIFSLLGM